MTTQYPNLITVQVTPAEHALILWLRDNPLQHEHVVRIEDDRWTWTLQHPIEERIDGLWECLASEHLLYWLESPGAPGPGEYVVDDSDWENHRSLTLTATKDWSA